MALSNNLPAGDWQSTQCRKTR